MQEKIGLIYDKFYKKQRITYEEYAILLFATNDELCILYKNVSIKLTTGFLALQLCISLNMTFVENLERSETPFSTELLDKFKIEGKGLKRYLE